MSGYSVSTGSDGYTIWHPRTPRVGTCGLILFPGQGYPTGYMTAAGQQGSVNLAAELASCGIPIITSTFGGNSWATDTVMNTYIPNARTALQTAFPAMRTDKICLGGLSMGATQATRYTQLHPNQVAATFGMIPGYDPKAIYIANNVGDAAMEAAWGFTGLENFPDALDLGPKGALANTVPIWTGYAASDTSIPEASVTAYHTLAGGLPENIVSVPGTHDNTAIENMPIDSIARFLVANGA